MPRAAQPHSQSHQVTPMTPLHHEDGSASKRSECLSVEVKAAMLTAVSEHHAKLIQVLASAVRDHSLHVGTGALVQSFCDDAHPILWVPLLETGSEA